MKSIVRQIAELLGKPRLVEFDYRDTAGTHHGRCFVRYLFASEERIRRMMSSCGYTNIHIA